MINEPELLIGHYITFRGSDVPDGHKNKYYKVTNKEIFQYETGREDTAVFASTVASGADSGYRNLDVLEPDKKHMFWVVPGFKDGCRYYIKIPTGTQRLGIDQDMDIGYLRNWMSPWIAPNPELGFYITEDLYPAIAAYNDMPVTLTPKVWFFGIRYVIEEIQDKMLLAKLVAFVDSKTGQPCAVIILGGVG